jgi:hypothetical protein
VLTGNPTVGNANTYIDQVLENVRVDIREKQLDPANLGDMGDCKDCWLDGLSTIFRSGDATLSTRGESVVLDVNLGLGEVKGRCECRKKFARFIKVKGKVWARVKGLQIRAVISQTLEGDTDERKVELFDITNEGSLDVGVSGGGIRRIINNALLAIFKGRIKNKLRESIRNKLPDMVRKVVQSKKFNINA